MTIGERIKTRREQLGLSQEDLAHKLGYRNRSSINKIEQDKQNLRQTKIKAIADALDTTPEYIMGWDEIGAHQMTFFEDDAFQKNDNTFTDNEMELINLYRNLDDSKKRQLVEYLAFLKHQQNNS